ncbi:putative metal-nicotianamine transporter YSL8 [Abeliophyllum distichum]|uniref:Metal-nicotianamine transporter YSL8 n=1 Tax=Abeliophyllum distichum TaxID=126358 RepID=A0ABD1V793_9LAMI
MMNIVSTTSDLMQEFKTGYTTLASPRSMFVSQVIGTIMGCVISPCVFWIFYKAFPDLGMESSEYPAPFASVYYSMAKLGVEGFSALPMDCLKLCYAFFSAAILINIIRDRCSWNETFVVYPTSDGNGNTIPFGFLFCH